MAYALDPIARLRRFIAAMAIAAALLFASPTIQVNQVLRAGEIVLLASDEHSAEPPRPSDRTLPAPLGFHVEIYEIPALRIVFAKVVQRARDGPRA